MKISCFILHHLYSLVSKLFLCFLGVLEEARFFGIEQLAEQLEVAIKVKEWECLKCFLSYLCKCCNCLFICGFKTEFTSTWRSLSTFPEGVCSIFTGYADQIRATLPGRRCVWNCSVMVSWVNGVSFFMVCFPIHRVWILVELIFLGLICAILILKWQIWVVVISPMQTCAAQTWREQTYREPTWMWDEHLFFLSFSISLSLSLSFHFGIFCVIYNKTY